jgi:pantoate--beta-alanine ligase
MRVARTPAEARSFARALARPLGFVPTMGALHQGHRSLFDRARRESAAVAASIFVNPLQFGAGEDFERYPRALESDLAMLEAAGVALAYVPSVEQMYPSGFCARVSVGEGSTVFEGAARPGHFDGVAVVVTKLLHAIEPTKLYLGRKDMQQIFVLRRLVADLDMAVDVVACETVREPDGLALSSRNAYLDQECRRAAPSLYRALLAARGAIERGCRDLRVVRAEGMALLQRPLQWEYLEVLDPCTFAAPTSVERSTLIVGAARAGGVRLIDNLSLPEELS